ncbi:DEAD/DEAH box helicase [Candidatus Ichthyocystis sparus]|uniref:DEAD/DEAH box helicase n=1 Tax=Candidatus Ichthyocystis sparus TaxID=1561004 RepID=UPI000A47E3CD|nr:DEAD/DEAH box helicase [Candidatus Ichthyocystis sparus]
MSNFKDLGLIPELLSVLDLMGYENPTPIQEQAIPAILSCQDVLGIAHTGTGKTASFALPIIQRIAPLASRSFSPARHSPRVLILEPTRELALQVCDAVSKLASNIPIRSCSIFGGTNMEVQSQALREGREILVATPGRLLDHLNSQTARFQEINILVLDEVDCMLDMGFLPDITRIIAYLPVERQNLMFSATISPEIDVLAQKILRHPVRIQISELNSVADTIEHVLHPVSERNRQDTLIQLLESSNSKTLVFVETKDVCARLARLLSERGLSTAAIHGDKSQKERVEALESFKSQSVDVLIATDIAARGLDISDLPEVINFSLPQSSESYIHRIGRTGRRGQKGIARSLVTAQEEKRIKEIEDLIGKKIKRVVAGRDRSMGVNGGTCANNKPYTPEKQNSTPDDFDFSKPYVMQHSQKPGERGAGAIVSPLRVTRNLYGENKSLAALFRPVVKSASD